MPKQAYVSISDLAWKLMEYPAFSKLKVGFVGKVGNSTKYKIVRGIPARAKLVMVIYLYEDKTLPDVENPLAQPPMVVVSKKLER